MLWKRGTGIGIATGIEDSELEDDIGTLHACTEWNESKRSFKGACIEAAEMTCRKCYGEELDQCQFDRDFYSIAIPEAKQRFNTPDQITCELQSIESFLPHLGSL